MTTSRFFVLDVLFPSLSLDPLFSTAIIDCHSCEDQDHLDIAVGTQGIGTEYT